MGSGAVKVFKTFRDGRTATLRHVRPGQTFAESVLYSDAFPASAETMADAVLYRFGVADFRRLVVDEPETGIVLLSTMAQLMVMLNQRVEELLLPVPARLARYLLDLCSEQGTPTHCHCPTTQAGARRPPRHRARDAQPHVQPVRAVEAGRRRAPASRS